MRYLYLVCLFALFGCSFSTGPRLSSKEKRAPLIIVSLPPYKTLAEQVGGSTIRVVCAVPSNVDPHGWEPTYKDLAKFHNAKIWFTIGEEFEPALIKKLKSTNPGLQIVDLREALATEKLFSEPGSEHPDTHFWLDPILDILTVNEMRASLTTLIPQNQSFYEDRFLAVREELSAIQAQLSEALAPYKDHMIVTTHGAYTYFCHRYQIEQVVVEPSEGKEPKTKDFARLMERLQDKKALINGIFLQPNHSNQAAEMIAKKLDLPTYTVDPYEPDYITTMQAVCADITKNRHQ